MGHYEPATTERGPRCAAAGCQTRTGCPRVDWCWGIADCLESFWFALPLSLSANPIAQMVSICNHHRTVISPQSPASSGITTVCLSSPFPSEHRRGVMLYSRVWNQISGTSKGKYLKEGHVRIKANAPKPSGIFALPQIFPAPTSSNLPHPALPSPWCMRAEYVHAIAMSRFPIRPPDAFCTQFINSFIHTIRLYPGEAGKSASLRTLRTCLVLGCFG
jgi:hypothetical protein